MFLTKKNFLIKLQVGETQKILADNPDSFINTILMEEKLLKYIEEKPDVKNITINKKNFLPAVRFLCIIILDWKFDLSAEVIYKTSVDTYYQEVIRQVVVDILLEEKFYTLAELVKRGNANVKTKRIRVTPVYKSSDTLQTKYVSSFVKYILQNTNDYNDAGLKDELKRFLSRILD